MIKNTRYKFAMPYWIRCSRGSEYEEYYLIQHDEVVACYMFTDVSVEHTVSIFWIKERKINSKQNPACRILTWVILRP
jgi:hypothetical protein